MEIRPLVNIGDTVNIRKGLVVQTNYGWNVRHLYHKEKGFKLYQVYDIEVNISLKTGKIEYRYLIGDNDPFDKNLKYFFGGWVDGESLEVNNINEKLA